MNRLNIFWALIPVYTIFVDNSDHFYSALSPLPSLFICSVFIAELSPVYCCLVCVDFWLFVIRGGIAYCI